MLFSRWGAFVYRFRRPIALLTVVLAIAGALVGSKVTDSLTSGGWTDPHSESAAVATRLADDFGAGRGSIVALYEGDASADASSPAFQQMIATSLARLAGDPIADGVIGYAQTRDRRFISTDGHSAYAVVRMYHCVMLRSSTSAPQRSQRPSTTYSFAITVWSLGHQLTGPSRR